MAYRLPFFIFFLFIFFHSGSQTILDENSQFAFRNWDNRNGLPQNTVSDIAFDHHGYLYAATEEGLIRFDGSGFTAYHEMNTEGLFSSVFYSISSGPSSLWASSRNTIIHLNEGVITTIDARKLLKGGWISCVESLDDHRAIAGTSNGKLFYIQGDSIAPYPLWNINNAAGVEVIRFIGSNIMIGTGKGLYALDTINRKNRMISMLASNHITTIEAGKETASMWVGTAEDGLFYVGKQSLHLTTEEGLKENYINSLNLDEDGNLWIGSRSSGFQVFNNGRFINPPQGNYSHDGIKSIITRNQEVWFGSTSSGLIQMKPAQIRTLSPSMEISNGVTLPVYQHREGDIWIGTAGKGVYRISGNNQQQFNRNSGLSGDLVLSLGGTGEYIYIGTANGLDRYNRTSGKIDRQYTKQDGLTTNSIVAIYNDSKNRLWVTTKSGGVHLLQGNRFQKFPLPAKLGQASFLTVFEDHQGTIWLGSRGAGMVSIANGDEVKHYNNQDGFLADIVFAFYQDRFHTLWMATEKGLLAKRPGGKFLLLDKSRGLRFNEIYRILEDEEGYIWMSGNPGLQRVSVEDLHNAMNGTGILTVKLFNTVDGMANAEANGGFHPAGWKMNNGEIWFPTVKGIAIADPRLIDETIRPVNIRIESFRHGTEEFHPGNEISLSPGVYNIEIHYTSIDFTKAGDIQYYYRMKGLDKEWISTGNRRVAYFAGLQPGRYNFEVKAQRYGRWSEVRSMEFVIREHFYRAAWFKALLVVIFILLVGAWFRVQRSKAHHRLMEQKNITRAHLAGQEKERQVIGSELHDNINQQLATARLYLDYAKGSEENRLVMVEKSEKVVQNVIREIRELCKSMIPPTLKDIGLMEAIQELLESYRAVEKFKIQFTCEACLENLEEDIRFTLFRITQELINNVARHAQAKHVEMRLYSREEKLFLEMTDDGKGFDTQENPSGIGLSNIRNRLELYDGKIDISSAPGQGTKVVVMLEVCREMVE